MCKSFDRKKKCYIVIFSSFFSCNAVFLEIDMNFNSNEEETPQEKSIKKVTFNFFAIFTRKSLFTKVAGRDSNTGVSCEYREILKNTYFEEHM